LAVFGLFAGIPAIPTDGQPTLLAESTIVFVKAEMKQPASHSVYLVESRLGLAKVGVAPDPQKRLRELQVGSPVKLELALAAPLEATVKPFPAQEEGRVSPVVPGSTHQNSPSGADNTVSFVAAFPADRDIRRGMRSVIGWAVFRHRGCVASLE
jgi:hypothetical protein